MDKQGIREHILETLKERLALFDIKAAELNNSFDLVKSGLLDSMAFVDLVANLETKCKKEVDFEKVADDPDFTTMGGLINIILNA